MAKRLGLGHKLGIDLPNEKPGLMPTRDWKLATFGTPWQQGETLISGIGQAYMLTTPLQLAVMTARICNGGFAVKPHLARDTVTANGVPLRPDGPAESLGIAPAHLDAMVKAMDAVVNVPRGTAYGARIREPSRAMAGKTGTAQVRRISKAERETGRAQERGSAVARARPCAVRRLCAGRKATLRGFGSGRARRRRFRRGSSDRP
jgi:penicillin-binding protein 2